MAPRVRVVESEDEFWAAVAQLTGPSDVFEDQGDAHGAIDGSLQDAIEAILVPLVGPWERSETWFHNQDFYGDGVRALTFRIGEFPWKAIGPLQKLLDGEAAQFCITVQLCDTLVGAGARTLGGFAILRNDLIATPSVLELLEAHNDLEA